MAKLISPEDLDRLRRQGATITREKREVSVDGLDRLVQAMAQAGDRAALVAAIESLVVALRSRTDPAQERLLEAVMVLQQQVIELNRRTAYRFEVRRDRNMLMEEVIATPVEGPTLQ
jgi:cytosine/adenosine deaminase-related metal-dependent hydrolase